MYVLPQISRWQCVKIPASKPVYMLHKKRLPSIVWDCCLKRQLRPLQVTYDHAPSSRRNYSTQQTGPPPEGEQTLQINAEPGSKNFRAEAIIPGEGRMSSRLNQMTDETLSHGGRSAEKVIEEAGFSEELKRQLEERINESTFKSENPAAFAHLNMPVGHLLSSDISLM